MDILQVENLSFSYYNVDVLNKINFSIKSGDFLGIIGANGTGKSTLIKIILGLLPIQKGSVQIFGTNRGDIKYSDRIGYVSQKANSFNSDFPATVKEVVMSNLYSKIGLFRHAKKEHKQLFQKAIEEVGMGGFENRVIGELSGGQQQKVFIARALVNNPELILFDEPTVGVDAKSVTAISQLIIDLNKKGITMIMTNHDTHSLISLANKLLVLETDGSAKFYDKSKMSEHTLKQLCAGLEGHNHG